LEQQLTINHRFLSSIQWSKIDVLEKGGQKMTEPIRITPETAWGKVTSGSALLVCAYDDEQKFNNNHLEGAISYAEFQSRLPSLSKNDEITFYCA